MPAFLSEGFNTAAHSAWTETIWARLAGWPVVAGLAWGVWHLLPHGNHNAALSALPTVIEPAALAFMCSALFLIVIGGYGLEPHSRLGPDWTSPTSAYLLFPVVAGALVRWTDLRGGQVPVIAIGLLLALHILLNLLFALMDGGLKAIEQRYPMPKADAPDAYPVQSWKVPVRDRSWHAVLTSRDPVLLREAAQEARGCTPAWGGTPAWGCDASEIADILDRRAAQYDSVDQKIAETVRTIT